MKQRGFKLICLIAMACIVVFSGFANEGTVNFETIVLESFNGDDDASYIWKTQASRFASVIRDDNGETVEDENGNAKKYPVLTYVEAYPMAAFGVNRINAGNSEDVIRSFGLNGRFDRRGYNWIDLYPTRADDEDGKPYEIPIPGRVISFDMWVWGANLHYYMEIYVRDHRGVVHNIRLGEIAYPGWRNLRVSVPNHISQSRRTLPSYAGLHFVKFRIWTTPAERVDNFYIYFKQFRILTDTFMGLFDGNDLANPAVVDRLWSEN